MDDLKAKVPKNQQAAVNRYITKHYDRLNLTVPKGDREFYKEYAEKHGMSLNQLFVTAVKKYIELSEISENNIADSE